MPSEIKQYRKHSLSVYHNYYKRTGLYRFLGKTLIKLFLILISIVITLYFIEKYIIDFDTIFRYLFEEVNRVLVFIIFFISETLLGLIPPDLFTAWAKQCPNPYLGVAILSILSYLGGVFSYLIGKQIRRIPRINRYIRKKYDNHIKQINKYGGFVIVFAALFPLPFSTITMLAGVLHYPFKKLILLSLFRIIRIFGYAVFIFWGLNKML
jgi:membrane protein YqaA with SNARE-associated domain